MEVWSFVARLAAHVTDHLPPDDAIPLPHGRVIQVGVERVIAAAVIDQDLREVEA